MHRLNNRGRLEALINYYSEGNKSMFGRLIGLQPSSITNWIRRDTLDFELVYSKCANLNPHWLLTGEGEMLKSTVHQSNPQQEAAPAQLTGLIQELMNELRQKNERGSRGDKARSLACGQRRCMPSSDGGRCVRVATYRDRGRRGKTRLDYPV